jgi:hypothetical protein
MCGHVSQSVPRETRSGCMAVDNSGALQAQSVLAILLPKLRPLLWDPVVRVRAAMAQLLERVSTLNTIKWTSVMPAEELVDILATDKNSAVGPIIQRMLFSQFVSKATQVDMEVRSGLRGCSQFTLTSVVCHPIDWMLSATERRENKVSINVETF